MCKEIPEQNVQQHSYRMASSAAEGEHQKALFLEYLRENERSAATIDKYERDIRKFLTMLPELQMETGQTAVTDDADFSGSLTKDLLLAYKEKLKCSYSPASVNSMLVALNRFLQFAGRSDLCVRLLRLQPRMVRDEELDLTETEFRRLLRTAKKEGRMLIMYLMKAIGLTGIRVSEHRFITVESLKRGFLEIENKGRSRRVVLNEKLRDELLAYCKKETITKGPVFCGRSGKVLNRSRIWRMMKELAGKAGVPAKKVFPHNLRHLFALTFYELTKDVVHLADILGHASIDTTRIYTCSSMRYYKEALARVSTRLVVPLRS